MSYARHYRITTAALNVVLSILDININIVQAEVKFVRLKKPRVRKNRVLIYVPIDTHTMIRSRVMELSWNIKYRLTAIENAGTKGTQGVLKTSICLEKKT